MSRFVKNLPKDNEMHGLLRSDFETLFKLSREAQRKAYCPYSNFHVGAVLLLKSGQVFMGANVENASYPVGICAERVALGTAVTSGVRRGTIKAIGVAADMEEPCSPCGMCRQALVEFCPEDLPVVMLARGGPEERYAVKTIGELLPLAFQNLPPPESLPNHN